MSTSPRTGRSLPLFPLLYLVVVGLGCFALAYYMLPSDEPFAGYLAVFGGVVMLLTALGLVVTRRR
ncbi:MAG TPA: hypothetical protein VFD01_08595 [Candidatus Dormibacteraeota bacterium]|jgi:hypothetical protein|nr:hypothetical protein [Candidatus Dormibacteraeota bacterium]